MFPPGAGRLRQRSVLAGKRAIEAGRWVAVRMALSMLTVVVGAGTAMSDAHGRIGPMQRTSDLGSIAARAQRNSSHFVNVARRDRAYVPEPLIARDTYDPKVAAGNTRRIRAILQLAPTDAVIYFPAGVYHFDGAAGGQAATIETTRDLQTFAGDGMNATFLRQHSRAVPATLRIRHDRCIIRDLSIGASDHSAVYQAAWDADPLQTAIHLDAPPGSESRLDPQIIDVSVNSRGNDIVLKDFYRPFNIAIKVTGPWLDVYVHTMWLRDVKTGIHVNQGARFAGPAAFMDINFVTTSQQASKIWTTFFKSETHMMEQVELLHCFFIGAQFISMEGRPTEKDPAFTPVYNMVIDHNYINTVWLDAGDDPARSGVYINLPRRKDGAYSRDIRFTNNSVTGRSPGRGGAFFYVQGTLRGLTFADNDCSSGLADKCVYVRATDSHAPDGLAVRDIKITDNYFRNYKTPITIGGDYHDPSRAALQREQGDRFPGRGFDDDTLYTERVIISGNQTMQEVDFPHGYTACYVNRCRNVSINGNTFCDNPRSVIVARECEQVTISNNTAGGTSTEADAAGIELLACRGASVTANVLRRLRVGVRVSGSRGVTVGANIVRECRTGLAVSDSRHVSVAGNQVLETAIPLALHTVRSSTVVGNVLDGGAPALDGENAGLVLRGNIGIPDRDHPPG